MIQKMYLAIVPTLGMDGRITEIDIVDLDKEECADYTKNISPDLYKRFCLYAHDKEEAWHKVYSHELEEYGEDVFDKDFFTVPDYIKEEA